jgi:hypothetical protein
MYFISDSSVFESTIPFKVQAWPEVVMFALFLLGSCVPEFMKRFMFWNRGVGTGLGGI